MTGLGEVMRSEAGDRSKGSPQPGGGPRCCRATERNRGSAEGLMGDSED